LHPRWSREEHYHKVQAAERGPRPTGKLRSPQPVHPLSAEVATSIPKNYWKAKRRRQNVKVPRATKLIAKMGNQGYKIVDGKLRTQVEPREYFYIPLHKRAMHFLSFPKAKTLECCSIDRHMSACLNMLKTQDESLQFSLDRSTRVAVIRPLNEAMSQSGEVNSTTHHPKS
jgi:hypothetical protein